MTFLRYAYEHSPLGPPEGVALFVDDAPWLGAQVVSEFSQLFPGVQLAVDPTPADAVRFPLHVRAYRESPRQDLVRWVREHRPVASLGIALYCVDSRRFELVASTEVDRWVRRQRLIRWGSRLRTLFPRTWNRLSAFLLRCEYFS